MSRTGSSRYTVEPADKAAFTQRWDRTYTRLAGAYDLSIRLLPVWRRWLSHALPHIRGPRVLEASFGTGWLLTRYAGRVEAHGIDLNKRMVEVARRNLERAGLPAELRRANVEELPYRDGEFDTVVSTMAFTGYPDGRAAMAELVRVLRPGGRLVMVDVAHPRNGNRRGTALVRLWERSGDVIRDLGPLFDEHGLDWIDREVGGWGSVHLYLAERPA